MSQLSLFNNETSSGAVFSPCGKYRYILWRIWDELKPKVQWIGLNPSTASQTDDDPTIRRIKNFSKSFGFGGMYMTNLFGLISAYPEKLIESDNPMGDNLKYLIENAKKADKIVFCWGSFKEAKSICRDIIDLFPDAYCLGKNKDGTPIHPLFVPAKTNLIKYAT